MMSIYEKNDLDVISSNMQGKSILEGLLFSPGLKRDVSHGFAPFQAIFSLRGERRLVVGEEDLETNRIASVFKAYQASLLCVKMKIILAQM